jgi:hypothetical protein
LEVADILRAHGDAYRARHPVSPEQAAVMRHLVACRTAALGGHIDACRACGYCRISYNSCRDRHCPKCQASRQAEWLETRLSRLLPVEYFHVVFTLPEQLKPLALKNQRLIYTLLFRAASASLLQLAADPKRLGAQIGVTAVLHTWGQNLLYHPHLHCVVTGGGLSSDQSRWVKPRKGFFLPVKVLGKLFRGKFLAELKAAYLSGQLSLCGSVAELACPRRFGQLLATLYTRDWVVYCKRPFGGAEQVYRYLGRYTHRVAISNGRLVSMQEGRVRFRYKDYADEGRKKQMSLAAEEFIRRFLLHVLPKRFVRIRHYGLLASRNVSTRLRRCQQLLAADANASTPQQANTIELTPVETAEESSCCPQCQGLLKRQYFDPPKHVAFPCHPEIVWTVPILNSS